MHADVPPAPFYLEETYYPANEENLTINHKVSSTVHKIINLCPKCVLGESTLFNYDSFNQQIVLSSPFQNLLKLLVELSELDHKALTVNSLNELSAILQQPQGPSGGLLRQPGKERWELEDNLTKQVYRKHFEELLCQLGFISPKLLDSQMTVDHCILFGARTERMETRIIQTIAYLKDNLRVTGQIFLLGSNRKLISEEIDHLKRMFKGNLKEFQAEYWSNILEDKEQATESNAFMCLWECLVPEEIQIELKNKLIAINSTRFGNGHRATTEVTVEDWVSLYNEDVPQAIFALAEQPYLRIADQLRFTVLTKGKKANENELIERIKNTTFYFATPTPNSLPKISIFLDEIARNVYRLTDTLKYFESLN